MSFDFNLSGSGRGARCLYRLSLSESDPLAFAFLFVAGADYNTALEDDCQCLFSDREDDARAQGLCRRVVNSDGKQRALFIQHGDLLRVRPSGLCR